MNELITIQTALHGTQQVEAEVIGQLGLHPTATGAGASKASWTITHIHSGYAVYHLDGGTIYGEMLNLMRRLENYDFDAYEAGEYTDRDFTHRVKEEIYAWNYDEPSPAMPRQETLL